MARTRRDISGDNSHGGSEISNIQLYNGRIASLRFGGETLTFRVLLTSLAISSNLLLRNILISTRSIRLFCKAKTKATDTRNKTAPNACHHGMGTPINIISFACTTYPMAMMIGPKTSHHKGVSTFSTSLTTYPSLLECQYGLRRCGR